MEEKAESINQQNLDHRRQEWRDRRKSQRQSVLNKTRICLDETIGKKISSQELKEITSKFKKKGLIDIPTLRKLQQALSQGEETIKEVMKQDWILPSLVTVLTGKKPEQSLEAAGCLTNLSVGDHSITYRVAKAAGAYLITLVNSSSPLTQEQCLWTLGNIAADCSTCCELVYKQGFLPVCLFSLSSSYPSTREAAALALSSFLRNTWDKENIIGQEDGKEIVSLCRSPLPVGLCWSLFYLSCSPRFDFLWGEEMILQIIYDCLINFSEDEKLHVSKITPLVRFFGNISCSSGTAVTVISLHPATDTLLPVLLRSCHNHVIQETLWMLDNLAGINPSFQSKVNNLILSLKIPVLEVCDLKHLQLK